MPDWKKEIIKYKKEYLGDLTRLVSIPSVRSEESAKADAPFGKEIRDAFDCFLDIAKRCGFKTKDCGGYACHGQIGTAEEYIGVLGHLDVVGIRQPELWTEPPFTLCQKGDMLYARGVNDDKGPLLAALYAARIVNETKAPLKRSIRIIAGGAEETTWECMEHYFSKYPQPVMGFSPDGNFPIVNGEKGILKYDLLFERGEENRDGACRISNIRCETLENYVCGNISVCMEREGKAEEICFKGKSALSRNPQKGENALWKLAEAFPEKTFAQPEAERVIRFLKECLINDYYGKKSGLYGEDEKMGSTSICPTGLRMDEKGIHLYLDIRYPKSTDEAGLQKRMEVLADTYGFRPVPYARKRLLYVPEDSELIVSLKGAYEHVTGEKADAFTKGGASYARTLDCGVAFGATFDGEETNPHMPNECMSLSSIWRAMEIYCESLWRLAVEC